MDYFVEIKNDDNREGYWASAKDAQKIIAEGGRVFEDDKATKPLTELTDDKTQTDEDTQTTHSVKLGGD